MSMKHALRVLEESRRSCSVTPSKRASEVSKQSAEAIPRSKDDSSIDNSPSSSQRPPTGKPEPPTATPDASESSEKEKQAEASPSRPLSYSERPKRSQAQPATKIEKPKRSKKQQICELEVTYNGVSKPFLFKGDESVGTVKVRAATTFGIILKNGKKDVVIKKDNEELKDMTKIKSLFEGNPIILSIEKVDVANAKPFVIKVQVNDNERITSIEFKDNMTCKSLKDEIAKKENVKEEDDTEISIIYGGVSIPDNVLVETIYNNSFSTLQAYVHRKVFDYTNILKY